MRKQDFLGWVFVLVFGTIGGLAGTVFFAIWFIGCGTETFASVELPLPESDSGKEMMVVDGGDESFPDTAVKDSAPSPLPCSLDADIGDAAIEANSGDNSCFLVTSLSKNDGGMGVTNPASCSAPVDCAELNSYVCYGGDGGQFLSHDCSSVIEGVGNIWWGCCP